MGPVGVNRAPLTVVLLTLVTCGIYGIYWQYVTFKEMKDHSGSGIGGGLGLVLAIFFAIANVFIMPSEVGNLYQHRGEEPPVSAMTGFWILIPLVGYIVWVYKVQGRLNDYWDTAAGAEGAVAATPPVA